MKYIRPRAIDLSNQSVHGQVPKPQGSCSPGAVISWEKCLSGQTVSSPDSACGQGTLPSMGTCNTGGNVSLKGCLSGWNDFS